MIKLTIALLIVCGFALGCLPMIDQWERDNHYPFGKMCDLTASCR